MLLPQNKLLKAFLGLLAVATIFGLSLITMQQRPLQVNNKLPHHDDNSYFLQQPKNYSSNKFHMFHLDLKGAPPKMAYILQILPLIKKAGANSILVEYEDMFPWSGLLRNTSAKNAFSKEEVKSLVNRAAELDLQIVPLVQTFGHLEFILKLSEFRQLRELDLFPQEICPAKEQVYTLIKEMIKQVMDMHRNARYIHIGCDEVYHLAACSICSRKNSRAVFISHVRRVASHIQGTYPDVNPIIWDDMLRRWSPKDIEESGLGQYVELMVWVYIEDIPRLVPTFILYTYRKSFQKLWGASAFKGAFGEQEVLPDLSRHANNNLAWQRMMSPPPSLHAVLSQNDFRGLVITGWSRYDHFAVLTELLPVALPSLILCLAIAKNYAEYGDTKTIEKLAIDDMGSLLNCPQPYPRTLEEIKLGKYEWKLGYCHYPGSQVYKVVNDYLALKSRMDLMLRIYNANGWVTSYNQRHNFSSPFRILQVAPEEGFAGQKLLQDVQQFKHKVQDIFRHVYDDATINEWIEQKIFPIEEKLTKLKETFQVLLETKSWPRRPLLSDWTLH